MGDDGIGSLVLRELSSRLGGEGVGFLYGETDVDYVLDHIWEGDFLIILDAAYTGQQPGSVTVMPIGSFTGSSLPAFSQHQSGFLSYLSALRPGITSYVIGIEAGRICFGTELSEPLKVEFLGICETVYEAVNHIFQVENSRFMSYTVDKKL